MTKSQYFLMLRGRQEHKTQRKHSSISTEGESCQERQEGLFQPMRKKQKAKKDKIKYKTELCKTFSQKGSCPYKRNCRFAHGHCQLVTVTVSECFRTKKCNGFWQQGCCLYGGRCQFAHHQKQWKNKAVLMGVNSILDHPQCQVVRPTGKLMNLLFPPYL